MEKTISCQILFFSGSWLIRSLFPASFQTYLETLSHSRRFSLLSSRSFLSTLLHCLPTFIPTTQKIQMLWYSWCCHPKLYRGDNTSLGIREKIRPRALTNKRVFCILVNVRFACWMLSSHSSKFAILCQQNDYDLFAIRHLYEVVENFLFSYFK